MEELFHPVSGEKLFAFTDREMSIVRLALKNLDKKTSSHEFVSGVRHG